MTVNEIGAAPQTVSLSLLGVPTLWRSGEAQVLKFKHRKAVALLGFLVAQPHKPLRRDAVAEMLWPDMAKASARSNLRVTLADVQGVCRGAGLESLIQADRDHLVFSPEQGLRTDFTRPPALGALDQRGDAVDLGMNWLAGMDDMVPPDFLDWLLAQRHAMKTTPVAPMATPHLPLLDLPESALGQTDAPPDPPGADPRQPEIIMLALLRIESGVLLDQLEPDGDGADWHMVLARLEGLAPELGGQLIESDASSCTWAFGLDSEHTGYRWQALRAAAAIHIKLGGSCALRMAATAGRIMVMRSTDEGLLCQGWRLRFLQRLSLHADCGDLVCCEGFSDLMAHLSAQRCEGVRFRGFDRAFTVHVQPLNRVPHNLLPLSGGGFVGAFVGRQRVVAQVQAHWAQPSGHVVVLRGQPGLGKTRLAWEMLCQLRAAGHFVFWIGARPETQRVAWRALRDAVLAFFPGGEGSMETLQAQLWARGHVLPPAQVEALFTLCHDLSVAQAALPDLLQALVGMSRTAQADCPTVCMVDDVQWLDATSFDMVERWMRAAPHVCWLMTQRMPGSEQGVQPALSVPRLTVDMQPLSDAEALEMVRSLPDGARLADDQLRGRVANARGVPLYLLADVEASEEGNAHFGEFCNAMLNRVSADGSVLQVAAVLGMRFAASDVEQVTGLQPGAALERAQVAGLLVARGGDELAFFHPRLREHLLMTLPRRRWRDLASRCARLLQARGQAAEAAELWQQADQPDEARQCWMRAAVRATGHGDLFAASGAFDQLAALGYFPGADGFRARAMHVRCLLARFGYGHAPTHRITQQINDRMADLAGHPDLAFDAISLTYLSASAQDPLQGLSVARRMLADAQNLQSSYIASWAMANSLFWMGDFAQARLWFHRMEKEGDALELSQRMRYFPSDPLVFGHGQMAWMEWLCGNHEASQQARVRMAEYARRSATPQDRAIHHVLLGLLHWLDGQFAQAQAQATLAKRVTEGEGFTFWDAFADMLMALADAEQGLPVDFVALARRADQVEEGYPVAVIVALWLASAALLASGHHELALSLADGTLDKVHDQAHATCHADVWRIKARAHAALGDQPAADAAMARACEWARRSGLAGWLQRFGP